MCLPSRCLETNVVSEPFVSNGCFSGSTVLALSKYATVPRTHTIGDMILYGYELAGKIKVFGENLLLGYFVHHKVHT
jgi:hypothetical protein